MHCCGLEIIMDVKPRMAKSAREEVLKRSAARITQAKRVKAKLQSLELPLPPHAAWRQPRSIVTGSGDCRIHAVRSARGYVPETPNSSILGAYSRRDRRSAISVTMCLLEGGGRRSRKGPRFRELLAQSQDANEYAFAPAKSPLRT